MLAAVFSQQVVKKHPCGGQHAIDRLVLGAQIGLQAQKECRRQIVGTGVLGDQIAVNGFERPAQAVGNYIENIPDETISKLSLLPFKNYTDARRFEDGLRKAGLPE